MSDEYKAFKTEFTKEGNLLVSEIKPSEKNVFDWIDYLQATKQYLAIEQYKCRIVDLPKDKEGNYDYKNKKFEKLYKGVHDLASRRLTNFPNKDDLEFYYYLRKEIPNLTWSQFCAYTYL